MRRQWRRTITYTYVGIQDRDGTDHWVYQEHADSPLLTYREAQLDAARRRHKPIFIGLPTRL